MAVVNKPLAIDYNILMFSDRDLENVQISNTLVSCVLVNNGSRVSVLFKDAVEKMGTLEDINKGKTTLHTFNGAPI